MVTFVFLFSTVAMAGVPSGTLLIGNKAFDIAGYLVNPDNATVIQEALDGLNDPSQMYYNIEGVTDTWTGLLNEQGATAEELASLGQITYTGADGTQNVYEGVAGDIVSGDAEMAAAVEETITALPAELTLADKDDVSAARTAFNALTEAQQALVTNVEVLEAAEARIAELEAAADYEAAKAAVEKKVAAYETLANADLSTQELVDAANTAKAEIILDGMNEEDTAAFQARIDAADALVTAAQEELDKLVVESVSAINSTVTVTFAKEVTEVPADLAILKDGVALELAADAFAVAEGTVVVTVPEVEAGAEEQSIVYSVQLGDAEAVAAEAVVVEAAEAVVTTVNVDAVSVEEYKTATPVVTVLDQFEREMADQTVTYAVDNAVVTVAADGTITAGAYVVDANTATLTATVGEASEEATITVTEDISVPALQNVTAVDSTTLEVTFSEAVTVDITNNANVQLIYPADTAGQNQVTLTDDGASVTYNGSVATIKLGKEMVNGDYYLKIAAAKVADPSGLTMAYTTKAFTASGFADSIPTMIAAAYNDYSGLLELTFSEAVKNADASVDETKITITGANEELYTLVNADYPNDVAIDNKIVTGNIKAKLTALTEPFTITLGAEAVVDATGNKNAADTVGVVATHTNAPVLTGAAINEKAQTLTLTFDKDVAVMNVAYSVPAGTVLKLTGAVSADTETTYTDDGTVFDLTGLDTNVAGTTQVLTISGTKAFIATTDVTAATITLPAAFAKDATDATLLNNEAADVTLTYDDDTTAPTFTAAYNSLTKVLTLTFDEAVSDAIFAGSALTDDATAGGDVLINVKYATDDTTLFAGATGITTTNGADKDRDIVYTESTDGKVFTFTFETAGLATAFDNPVGDVYVVLNASNVKDEVGTGVDPIRALVDFVDLIPPAAQVVNAAGVDTFAETINSTTLRVEFNEKVDAATAQDVNNYSMYASLNPGQILTISSATLLSDQKTVVVKTSEQLAVAYTLEITNIKDLAPAENVIIANDSKTAASGTFCSKITAIQGSVATATAATLQSAVFTDEDNSGTISTGDKITMTFDAELADGTYSASDVALFEGDDTAVDDETLGTDATVAKDAADATKLVVTLGTGADFTIATNKIDLSATTTVKDSTDVAIGASKQAISNGSTGAPAISSVVFTDVDGDGVADATDTLIVTFDMPIEATYDDADTTTADKADALAGAFKYNKVDGTTYDVALPASSTAVLSADGLTVTITLGGSLASAAANESGVRWTGNVTELQYKAGVVADGKAKLSSKWTTEAAGHASGTADNGEVALTGADAVGPQIEAVTYYDTSSSGVQNDTMIVDFDQPIETGTVARDDFTFTNGSFDTTGNNAITQGVDGDKLIITMGANANITPNPTLNIATGITTITDVYGNAATPSASAVAITIADDTTRPNLVSAVLVDDDSDGVISEDDDITFTFSEAVTTAIADAALDDGLFGLADDDLGTSAEVSSSWSADKTQLTIELGASPQVDFTTAWNPVNSALTDLAGNQDNTVFTVKIADQTVAVPISNAANGYVTAVGDVNAGANDDTLDVSVGSASPGTTEAITLEYKVGTVAEAGTWDDDTTADGTKAVATNEAANSVLFDEVVLANQVNDHVWLRAVDEAGNKSAWTDFGGDK